MCIRRQEGCYLSKAEPQSLKNSVRTTQWSVPCPPPHHTAPHQPYQMRENRSCPICQCMLDRFIYFLFPHPSAGTWPHYITIPDNIIPHAPEQMKLFLPETPALLLTLYGFTTSSDSGALAATICLSVSVEKSSMPTEHTKAWKSTLGCRQSLRCCYINRHQTTAQPSFGKWGKSYSPVPRCSKSKSHFLSFSGNFEPGLTHSGDCHSSYTFLP